MASFKPQQDLIPCGIQHVAFRDVDGAIEVGAADFLVAHQRNGLGNRFAGRDRREELVVHVYAGFDLVGGAARNGHVKPRRA